MKKIELKTLGPPPDIDYAQVLREVVRRPLNQQTGATIDEMRQSIRVLDALDQAHGVLELEDSDYEHLKQKLAAMQWALVDKRILQLVDDVNAAPEAASNNGIERAPAPAPPARRR